MLRIEVPAELLALHAASEMFGQSGRARGARDESDDKEAGPNGQKRGSTNGGAAGGGGDEDGDETEDQDELHAGNPRHQESSGGDDDGMAKLGEWLRDQQTMEDTITILQQEGWMV